MKLTKLNAETYKHFKRLNIQYNNIVTNYLKNIHYYIVTYIYYYILYCQG